MQNLVCWHVRVAVVAALVAGFVPGRAQKPASETGGMGACGKLNVAKAEYLTAEECAKRGGIFLRGVKPYKGMFVISA